MKLLRRIIVLLLVLTVSIPVIGYIALNQLGSERIAPLLGELITEKTGYVVTINGDVGAKFSLLPTIYATDITVRNPHWSDHKEQSRLLTLQHLEVTLNFVELLYGKATIEALHLRDGVVHLAMNGKHHNWDLAQTDSVSSSKTAPATDIKDQSASKASLTIRTLKADHIELHFQKNQQETQSITIKELSASLQDRGMNLSSLIARHEATARIAANSSASSLDQLAQQPVEFTADWSKDEAQFALDGTVALPFKADTALFTGLLSLQTPSLDVFNALEPTLALPATAALSLETGISAKENSAQFTVKKFHYDTMQASGALHVHHSAKNIPTITGDITLDQLVIPKEVPGENVKTSQPERANSQHNKVTSPAPLPFDALDKLNASIKTTIGRLYYGKKHIAENLTLDTHLKNAKLRIQTDVAHIFDGTLESNLIIDARTSPPRQSLSLKAQQLSASALSRFFETQPSLEKGNLNAIVDAQTRGLHMPAMQKNMQGTMRIAASQWQIPTATYAQKTGNFLNLLRGRESTGDTIDISCAIGLWSVQGATLTSQHSYVDTAGALLNATGAIDIANNTLSILLRTYPKYKDLSALAVPVRIDGTFANPSFSPDTKSALQTLAALKFGTSGSQPVETLIGSDFVTQHTEPSCIKNINQTIQAASKEDIRGSLKQLEDDVKQDGKDIEDNVRGLRDNIKNLKKLF